MTPEEKATEAVRLRATAWLMKLFRNNSGVLINPNGIPVRFGLGNESKKINEKFKSSDLVGIHSIEITPEMVGKKIGVFTAIEVKAEGFIQRESYPKTSREWGQKNFIDFIKQYGGMAGFASCEIDVDQIVHDYLTGLKE